MQSHRAFLLRCWSGGTQPPDEPSDWRFSIREIGGKQHERGFANLEALVMFLEQELISEGIAIEPETGDAPNDEG